MNITTLLCKLRVVCKVFILRDFHAGLNHVLILKASTSSDSIWVKFLCLEDAGIICKEMSLSKQFFTRFHKNKKLLSEYCCSKYFKTFNF